MRVNTKRFRPPPGRARIESNQGRGGSPIVAWSYVVFVNMRPKVVLQSRSTYVTFVKNILNMLPQAILVRSNNLEMHFWFRFQRTLGLDWPRLSRSLSVVCRLYPPPMKLYVPAFRIFLNLACEFAMILIA